VNTVEINVWKDGTNRNATRLGAIHAIEAELGALAARRLLRSRHAVRCADVSVVARAAAGGAQHRRLDGPDLHAIP
jgi:hypothetical protein